MGTEVQSKMYLQGYYSLRDLNNNAGKGSWPLHCEQNTLRSGKYHEIFLTRSEINGYNGHDKELLRQTILKHETVFRQQLCELHRLYKIQRDLMNDIKSEPHKHLIPAGTSPSNSFPSEDEKKRWHISMLTLDSSYGRPSTAGVDRIPSHFNSEQGKIMQSNCSPAQIGVRQKDYESLEPKSRKLQRRLFDLEIPAHEYINDEGEEQKVSGDLGVQSYPPNESISRKRDGNLSICVGVSTCCSADAFSSNVHLRKAPGLTDLSEKIQVDEAYASDILANNACSKEEMQRQDSSASAYSGFQCLATEFSQNLHNGRGGAVKNLRFDNESKQQDQLSYIFEAGKTRSNRSSFSGSFRPGDFPKPCESSHVEFMKAHDPATCFPSGQSKTEQQIKRTIFGVEISDANRDSSVVASHSLGLQASLVPKSDMANSKSFTISPWTKPPGSLSQHLTSTQGNPCNNTSPQSNKSSVTLTRSREVTRELLIDSYSKSIPDIRDEVSYQNDVYLGSQSVSNELHGCQPSGVLGFPNGINDCNFTFEQFRQHNPQKYLRGSGSVMDVKSAKKMNMDAVAPNDQYKVICEQNLVSVDWPRTQENSQGASSWLRPMSNFNDKYSREKEGSGHKNLGSWQNYSLQFVNKTEMINGPSQRFTQDSSSATCADDAEHGKIDKGTCSNNMKILDCSNNMKILGFPIIDKPHILKDLPSHSSPSKRSCAVSAIDIVNAGSVITDLAHDPMSPRSGELLKEKDQVVAKGLDSHGAPSRHQIDLNICVTEEEVLSTPSSPVTTQIDLEVPVVIDTEIGITPAEGSPESKSREHFASLHDESRVPCEGLIRVAAEALVSISLSHVHDLPSHAVDNNLQENATCQQSEASLTNSLYWLAEIISSCKSDTENKVVEVSLGEDYSLQEELIPDGIDFFEFMTLNLTESKVEDYCYKPEIWENQKDESTSQRRPRRRQMRRGRQRKDFQRDVLHSITSLSRNEVTEDLLTFEELIKATGCTWQSGLAHKNSSKSGGGRGRRRSVASNSASVATAACLPQVQQPKCIVLGLEEKSLTGWGKRTRRPARQRCLINNPPICLK